MNVLDEQAQYAGEDAFFKQYTKMLREVIEPSEG